MSQNKPGPRELALRAMREARAVRFTEIPKKRNPAPKEEPMPKPKSVADSKKDIVKTLLKRKNGCTGKDVKAATGWPSVSMPAIAKSCGLKLRIEKTDKGNRYYGSTA